MKQSLLRADDACNDNQCNSQHNDVTSAYDRHVDTVYRVCFSLTANVQDAEDVTQIVFIELMESGKSFVDFEHEKAWLITVARNRCRDLQRKWWRKKVVDIDTSDIELEDKNAIQNKYINDYLLLLPKSSRLVMYLYYYEGYKVSEIASLLKMNINTVKTQMRSARKRLKMKIGEDYDE